MLRAEMLESEYSQEGFWDLVFPNRKAEWAAAEVYQKAQLEKFKKIVDVLNDVFGESNLALQYDPSEPYQLLITETSGDGWWFELGAMYDEKQHRLNEIVQGERRTEIFVPKYRYLIAENVVRYLRGDFPGEDIGDYETEDGPLVLHTESAADVSVLALKEDDMEMGAPHQSTTAYVSLVNSESFSKAFAETMKKEIDKDSKKPLYKRAYPAIRYYS